METTNDTDIYADLPNVVYNDGIDTLRASNKSLSEENLQLKETITKIIYEKEDCQAKCTTLSTNLSSLLKTARAEIKRKDDIIDNLRGQLAEFTVEKQKHRNRRQNSGVDKKSPIKNSVKHPVIQSGRDVLASSFTSSNHPKEELTKIENLPNPNTRETNNDGVIYQKKCKTLYSQRMLKKAQEPINIERSSEQRISNNNNTVEENKPNGKSEHETVTNVGNSKHENFVNITCPTKKENESIHSGKINGLDNKYNSKVLSGIKEGLKVTVEESKSTVIKTNFNTFQNNEDKNIMARSVIQKQTMSVQYGEKNNCLEVNRKLADVNCKEGTTNDSSPFLRPLSTVIRKPCKKISPVSNNWKGLVKTVDIGERINNEKFQKNDIVGENKKCEINGEVNDETRKKCGQDSNNTSPKNILIEEIFGSPLKWADHSNESLSAIELSTPTVYEDSCSAQIENSKFSTNLVKPSLQQPTGKVLNSIGDNNKNYNGEKTSKGIEEVNKCTVLVNENESVRAFEDVGMTKKFEKSIFSPLKSDSSRSIGLNLSRDSPIDLSINFSFKSKYEDSVLEQFDDTTQFVSALTRVESKISPLNTPVKTTVKSFSILTNSELFSVGSKQLESVNEALPDTKLKELNINEKPINILYPRKTPRIVTYNKSKEQKPSVNPSPIVSETPSNRFAINDAFISQQEEKVLRNCKNNINDPIAITICAKSKTKGKDPHLNSPGKGLLQTCSPRKLKLLSPPSKKPREPVTPESPRNLNKGAECQDDNDGNKNTDSIKNGSNDVNHHDTRCTGTTKQDSTIIERIDEKHETNISPQLLPKKRKHNDLEDNIVDKNFENSFVNNRKSITLVCNINGNNNKSNCRENEVLNANLEKQNMRENISTPASNVESKYNKKPILNTKFEKKRVHDFKPSSKLKPNKNSPPSRNYSYNSDKISSCKRHNINYKQSEDFKTKIRSSRDNYDNHNDSQSVDVNQKVNVIIRSSRRPTFGSKLLDDKCQTIASVRSPDLKNNIRNREKNSWVLNPIAFDSPKKQKISSKDLSRYTIINKTVKPINHSDPVSPAKMSQSNNKQVYNNSPNIVIRGRRPVNFGIKATLD